MLALEPEFAARLPPGIDAFDYIMQLDGEHFRELENRHTLRFSLADKRYFLKAHYGVGWQEILKNLLQLRQPVLGARNEWRAIQRLQALGVDTMTLAGYGERGRSPATRQSFVITEALENTVSLEDYCAPWEAKVLTPAEIRLKRALIRRVAGIARTLHANGINHRDFYICHFLLDCSADVLNQSPESLRLSLIDLHRVQLRRRTPGRWVVKDIGGLYFSAMRIGLTRRDLYRFMTEYRRKTLRATLEEDGRFWNRCRQRAFALYRSYYSERPGHD
jgi:heptose I phosphotransferase